jgi:hypothetical protein
VHRSLFEAISRQNIGPTVHFLGHVSTTAVGGRPCKKDHSGSPAVEEDAESFIFSSGSRVPGTRAGAAASTSAIGEELEFDEPTCPNLLYGDEGSWERPACTAERRARR